MRSDFTKWGRPPEANVIENFERDLPKLVDICRQVADYAAGQGITFTVENHGTYINGGDRVRRLITAVDRENFRCTLDIGNGLCMDEDPMVTVQTLLPFAATVHFKDFIVRKDGTACGASGPAKFEVAAWLTTNYGNYVKGTIVGDGDVDVVRIAKYIKASGYDGAVSIEFEGMEECKAASKISLQNVKRYMAL
jgi:sugar phosphate isomerase/epimerase